MRGKEEPFNINDVWPEINRHNELAKIARHEEFAANNREAATKIKEGRIYLFLEKEVRVNVVESRGVVHYSYQKEGKKVSKKTSAFSFLKESVLLR